VPRAQAAKIPHQHLVEEKYIIYNTYRMTFALPPIPLPKVVKLACERFGLNVIQEHDRSAANLLSDYTAIDTEGYMWYVTNYNNYSKRKVEIKMASVFDGVNITLTPERPLGSFHLYINSIYYDQGPRSGEPPFKSVIARCKAASSNISLQNWAHHPLNRHIPMSFLMQFNKNAKKPRHGLYNEIVNYGAMKNFAQVMSTPKAKKLKFDTRTKHADDNATAEYLEMKLKNAMPKLTKLFIKSKNPKLTHFRHFTEHPMQLASHLYGFRNGDKYLRSKHGHPRTKMSPNRYELYNIPRTPQPLVHKEELKNFFSMTNENIVKNLADNALLKELKPAATKSPNPKEIKAALNANERQRAFDIILRLN
jgi:hypothetical protein